MQTFSALDSALGTSTKFIAGGKVQVQELKRLRVERKSREASEQAFIDDSRAFLGSTLPSSDTRGAVKAVFVVSMKSKPAVKNSLDVRENLT